MNTTTSSRACPDVGVWRAWLDEDEHPADAADHLATCRGCQRVLEDLRLGADDAAERLAVLAPTRLPSASHVAYARALLNPQHPRPTLISRLRTPWRIAASGIAAALALALIIAFTPEGGAAAAAFLAQFRSQEVTVLEVSPQSQADIMRTMSSLGALGTVKTPTTPAAVRSGLTNAQPLTPTEAADASRTIGFTLETPDPNLLPSGFARTPDIRLTPGSEFRFTFDQAKARAYFQSHGQTNVSLPDKFDGQSLVVSMPAAALLEYRGSGSRDALVVGEAGEVVVNAEGGKVSLQEMRDFLLSLPGLPQGVVAQLKQIQNWNDTLPIPIPIDRVHWQSTSFGGNKGLLLDDNTGAGSAAIWHANGHLFGVAGTLKAADLQRIAESLAVR